MATITKKDLIDRISEHTGQRRQVVKQTVQAFLNEVILELGSGNRLEFRDFGVFEIKLRAPRVAQNPKTLERVSVPAKRTVKFKVGRLMKLCLDDPEGCAEHIRKAIEAEETGPNGHTNNGASGNGVHKGRSKGNKATTVH
ncbi:MAG: integration host factor subunit beta [Phycisphaerales bacterium]|nr:integration host factor subunit beta [Phycisphaerales bacterium]